MADRKICCRWCSTRIINANARIARRRIVAMEVTESEPRPICMRCFGERRNNPFMNFEMLEHPYRPSDVENASPAPHGTKD